MLIQTPAAYFDSQFLDSQPLDAPAPRQSAALWFATGFAFSAALLYASVKYASRIPI